MPAFEAVSKPDSPLTVFLFWLPMQLRATQSRGISFLPHLACPPNGIAVQQPQCSEAELWSACNGWLASTIQIYPGSGQLVY